METQFTIRSMGQSVVAVSALRVYLKHGVFAMMLGVKDPYKDLMTRVGTAPKPLQLSGQECSLLAHALDFCVKDYRPQGQPIESATTEQYAALRAELP